MSQPEHKHFYRFARKARRTLVYWCPECGLQISITRGDIRRLTIKKRPFKPSMIRTYIHGWTLQEQIVAGLRAS